MKLARRCTVKRPSPRDARKRENTKDFLCLRDSQLQVILHLRRRSYSNRCCSHRVAREYALSQLQLAPGHVDRPSEGGAVGGRVAVLHLDYRILQQQQQEDE